MSLSPDYATLYAFETAIEAAAVTLFAANALTAFRLVNTGSVLTPRVEVQLVVGSARDHQGEAKDGRLLPDHWDGALRVRIFTTRDAAPADHSQYLAVARRVMYRCRENFGPSVLPYHEIFDAHETGSAPESAANAHEESSAITFAILFGIRADAWPH